MNCWCLRAGINWVLVHELTVVLVQRDCGSCKGCWADVGRIWVPTCAISVSWGLCQRSRALCQETLWSQQRRSKRETEAPRHGVAGQEEIEMLPRRGGMGRDLPGPHAFGCSPFPHPALPAPPAPAGSLPFTAVLGQNGACWWESSPPAQRVAAGPHGRSGTLPMPQLSSADPTAPSPSWVVSPAVSLDQPRSRDVPLPPALPFAPFQPARAATRPAAV